ncbi:MAG: YggS family pyridoxal phosphate-dependent enzyme [Pseudomonadota bacterium]|nr:YggS family pyridoxal phosphate-dependent enzyme [Pseudomonadota bacterium]
MSPDEKAWQDIRSRIVAAAEAARRDPRSIRVLAVSKTFSVEAIRAVYAMGQRAFGENYVQEAQAKIAALVALPDLEWHLIGPLQGNKARAASRAFAWVETVDRREIAQRLSAARDAGQPPINLCIQVNISGETSKHGVVPSRALALAREVARLPGLALRGFMGIAQTVRDDGAVQAQFRLLRELYDAGRQDGLAFDTLSMGMSSDFELAIAEGATELRIGSALFGPRIAQRSRGR